MIDLTRHTNLAGEELLTVRYPIALARPPVRSAQPAPAETRPAIRVTSCYFAVRSPRGGFSGLINYTGGVLWHSRRATESEETSNG